MKSKKTHPILTVILVFIIITIIALVCVLVIGLRNRAVNKAGSPATPVQNPYQWVKEPCLDYDWMHYTDGEYSGWWLDSYMIAPKGE